MRQGNEKNWCKAKRETPFSVVPTHRPAGCKLKWKLKKMCPAVLLKDRGKPGKNLNIKYCYPLHLHVMWGVWHKALQCPKSAHSSSSSSVQLPDDGVNICTTKPRVSQVLHESSFVASSVTSHRQLEWQQEILGSTEVLANRVDLVDEVLQTDDAVFAC